MQELKGLNTTEFYSRFFVETALEKHVVADVEQVKKLASLSDKFLTKYHGVSKNTGFDELFELQTSFHEDLISALGYKSLNPFFHMTSKGKGIPVRGKVDLLDDEELWIVEGPFGLSRKELDVLSEYPHCSCLKIFGDNSVDVKLDKSLDYNRLIKSILSEENKCSWIIFISGEKLFLFERTKTLEMGSYVEVDWPEVFSNKDSLVFRAIIGLFGYNAFKIVNGDIAHNQLAETAHREAHGVTKSLKHGVRDALELLINEVLYFHREVQKSEKLSSLEKQFSNEVIAKELADEGLRYLYRLLFLFFVESRGQESEILPIKSRAYSLGYSLENIRNLELKRISGEQNGNYIQETLSRTFDVMFYGVELSSNSEAALFSSGFECPRIGTLLFDKKKTEILEEVRLRDRVMKKVISKLSIGEVGKGKNKKNVRISYANLGLNQLGAVYEGLLSLKAIITEDEYCTVILGAKKEEFLIHKKDLKKFKSSDILSDDSNKPIIHNKGEFLFRTMGYERKYSASFYTDETLTKCLVKECLEDLFKECDGKPKVEQIENLKILEPAMGSGAFLNEAANQLSVYYVDSIVNSKTKSQISSDQFNGLDRKTQLNIAKEYIMRNCLYGVDLNPLAAELAKVSLWLNCVQKNGSFAFHDFKIRRGNSLVGALFKKNSNFSNDVYHFLAPLPSMLDVYIDSYELGDKKKPFFNKETIEDLKKKKKEYENISNFEDKLKEISKAVRNLYESHSNEREKFRKVINNKEITSTEAEEEFTSYLKKNSAYNQLRKIMDYWCSLWFWPSDKIKEFPSLSQFMKDVELVLKKGRLTPLKEDILSEVISKVPYFHYDLEFPEVFKKGGFDLVLGNPPWAKLAWSDNDYFYDLRPELHAKKIARNKKKSVFESILKESKEISLNYRNSYIIGSGIKSFLKKSYVYAFDDHSEINTYKYFWQRSRELVRDEGVYGLIKQDGITSDNGVESLRRTYFKELTKLYRFINEKLLFDIIHNKEFCLAVLRKGKKDVDFQLIDSLFHPITIERCHKASASCYYPGTKTDDGEFNLDGHPDRIVKVNKGLLELIARGEGLSNPFDVLLPNIYGKPELSVLEKYFSNTKRLDPEEWDWDPMLHESKGYELGYIDKEKPRNPKAYHNLYGYSNIDISNPYYKEFSVDADKHVPIDLQEVEASYNSITKFWITKEGLKKVDVSQRSDLKILTRVQVAGSSVARMLTTALVPKFQLHTNGLSTIDLRSTYQNIFFQACLSSLPLDFLAKTLTTGNVTKTFMNKLPLFGDSVLSSHLILRGMRLNFLSEQYQDFWSTYWNKDMNNSPSYSLYPPSLSNGKLKKKWSYDTAIRNSREREQVLCEIDVLVSFLFGLSKSDLIQIYRSQFGSLQSKIKDLPGQNVEGSFPRAKIMEGTYDMFLEFFGVSEKDVVKGYFNNQENSDSKVA